MENINYIIANTFTDITFLVLGVYILIGVLFIWVYASCLKTELEEYIRESIIESLKELERGSKL